MPSLRVSSLPKYGKAWEKYFALCIHGHSKFYATFVCFFFGMYCMNLQRALQDISCLSTVMFTFETKAFWHFLINGIQIAEAKQSLFCSRFFVLSGFKSKPRYLIISRYLWRDMLLVKKAQPQMLLHILLNDKFLSPRAPQVLPDLLFMWCWQLLAVLQPRCIFVYFLTLPLRKHLKC